MFQTSICNTYNKIGPVPVIPLLPTDCVFWWLGSVRCDLLQFGVIAIDYSIWSIAGIGETTPTRLVFVIGSCPKLTDD